MRCFWVKTKVLFCTYFGGNLQTIALKLVFLNSESSSHTCNFWLRRKLCGFGQLCLGWWCNFCCLPSTIRVNPKFQFHQRDPFGNGHEQQHSCLLSGYGCGPAVDGNEHPLSACGTSGHPAGTPITPEVSLSKRILCVKHLFLPSHLHILPLTFLQWWLLLPILTPESNNWWLQKFWLANDVSSLSLPKTK